MPALNCSIINSAAFLAGTPKGEAAGPDKNVTMPILTSGVAAGGV